MQQSSQDTSTSSPLDPFFCGEQPKLEAIRLSNRVPPFTHPRVYVPQHRHQRRHYSSSSMCMEIKPILAAALLRDARNLIDQEIDRLLPVPASYQGILSERTGPCSADDGAVEAYTRPPSRIAHDLAADQMSFFLASLPFNSLNSLRMEFSFIFIDSTLA